ncbi:hypothetical protein SADUNF_Sadunf19G0105800 [Salix dunnii]|uniref:Uncharacterized protein n=1 Tax=Salix dunnii TaxID=1413687 RepID=A0A835J4B6_9ROSI|nr:hypothetical protein SADUNF_Sadunf19G0105800 [Salix dunnii]
MRRRPVEFRRPVRRRISSVVWWTLCVKRVISNQDPPALIRALRLKEEEAQTNETNTPRQVLELRRTVAKRSTANIFN